LRFNYSKQDYIQTAGKFSVGR